MRCCFINLQVFEGHASENDLPKHHIAQDRCKVNPNNELRQSWEKCDATQWNHHKRDENRVLCAIEGWESSVKSLGLAKQNSMGSDDCWKLA
jgi:hypothetical protein